MRTFGAMMDIPGLCSEAFLVGPLLAIWCFYGPLCILQTGVALEALQCHYGYPGPFMSLLDILVLYVVCPCYGSIAMMF